MKLSEGNVTYWRAWAAPNLQWYKDHLNLVRERVRAQYNIRVGKAHENCLFGPSTTELFQEIEEAYDLDRLRNTLKAIETDRQNLLDHLAKFVDFQPLTAVTYHLVSSFIPIYQNIYPPYDNPTQAVKYAYGELSPFLDKLERYGFSAMLCAKGEQINLEANCYPWMFDAMQRQTTEQEANNSFFARGLNAAAYQTNVRNGMYSKLPRS